MYSRFSQSDRKQYKRSVRGFGLIELLVSVGIMMIVLTVIIGRHTAFNGAVLLRNQTYNIALSLREIQLSAVSASGVTDQSNNIVYRSLLGAYFSTGSDGEVVLFRDDNNNHKYDSGEEFGQPVKLSSNFEIREVKSGNNAINGGGLNVIFQRPNFDARFYNSSGSIINAAVVTVEVSKRDETGNDIGVARGIQITSTGQIAVVSL